MGRVPMLMAVLAGVLAVVLAGLLGGCKRKPPPSAPGAPASEAPAQRRPGDAGAIRQNNAVPSTRAPSTAVQPSSSDTGERSDVDIGNEVRREIAGDPTFSQEARKVDARVSLGVVVLTGTLATETEKENVRIAVGRMVGVKAIDNRIVVKK